MSALPADLLTLVYFANRSNSLYFHPLLAPFGKQTLLEVLLRACPRPCGLVCHAGSGGVEKAQAIAAREGAFVCQSRSPAALDAMLEALGSREGARAALLPGSFAFLSPGEMFEQMIGLYRREAWDFGYVKGLPAALGLELMSVELIGKLRAIPRGFLQENLGAGVRTLLAARDATRAALPFPIKAGYVDFPVVFGASPVRDLPRSFDGGSVELTTALGRSLGEECGGGLARLRVAKDTARQVTERSHRRRARAGGRRDGVPRVLYVSNGSATTGAEESLCSMIGRIDSGRLEKHGFVTYDGVFAERLRTAQVSVRTANEEIGPPSLTNVRRAAAVLDEVDPDLVHFNDFGGSAMLIATQLRGVPIVQHVRRTDLGGCEEALRAADVAIAVSAYVKDAILGFVDMEESRIRVLHNGIDLERFQGSAARRSEARRRLGLSDGAPVVLTIARFAPNKRFSVAAEAVALAGKRVAGLQWVVVGETFGPPDQDEFGQWLRVLANHEAAAQVHLLPFQSDIRTVEWAADVLLLLSEGEPLARCVMEAMALELPVVITDSGGWAGRVASRQSGFVIPAGDARAASERMAQLLTDSTLARTMGRNGRTLVAGEFEIGARSLDLVRIYESILSGGQLAGGEFV